MRYCHIVKKSLQEIFLKMISLEKKANLFGAPKYVIKIIMNKIFKLKTTPFSITTFKNLGGVVTVKFGEKKIIKEFKPKYVSISEKKLNLSFKNREYNQNEYLILINDVEVHSAEGLISKENKIVLDSYYGNPYIDDKKIGKTGYVSFKFHVQYMIRNFIKPSKTIKVDKAYIVTSRWSNNYFHWMTDVITKIGILEKNYNDVNTIVINKLNHEFQRKSLEIFKSKFKFIESNYDTTLFVSKAYTIATSGASFQKIEYLNSLYSSKTGKSDLNIYISREKAKKRRIKNQNGLDELLNKYNIQKVFLEDKSFEEQINIFRNSKIIVAPHGAGLTNLSFANVGTHVIELLPGFKTNNYLMFSEIAAYRNLNYYCLIDNKRNKRFFRKDFFVNLNELNEILIYLQII